jgi:hypothetical protein
LSIVQKRILKEIGMVKPEVSFDNTAIARHAFYIPLDYVDISRFLKISTMLVDLYDKTYNWLKYDSWYNKKVRPLHEKAGVLKYGM